MYKMAERRKLTLGLYIQIFFITAIAVVIIALIFHHITKQPTISYDNSLSTEEISFITDILNQKSISQSVVISAETTPEFDTTNKNVFAYEILVPVTGFYSTASSITASDLPSLPRVASTADVSATSEDVMLLPASELNASVRLLAVDDAYYLDHLDDTKQRGALFRIFKVDSTNPTEITSALSAHNAPAFKRENLLIFNQTGVTALTRQMYTKLRQVGNANYFSEKIADFLKSADLTHISNEVSFADDCNISSAMAFCADNRMFNVIKSIGTDIVELTGNHNNDWGASENINTINLYHDNNIDTVGGGINEDEAAKPLQISDHNNNVTLIAINNSTSTKANGQGASGEHPGANIYNPELNIEQIKAAKARGDLVIVDIQFFECYSYPDDGEEMPSCDYPISGQEDFFKSFIDAGADVVVGTQAHQPQNYELYQNRPIYYGLGNLFFDQINWPGTRRSLVLTHYLIDNQLVQTKVTPTIYDNNFQTEIMDESSKIKYLERLTSAYK